jgi:hypothetical protein
MRNLILALALTAFSLTAADNVAIQQHGEEVTVAASFDIKQEISQYKDALNTINNEKITTPERDKKIEDLKSQFNVAIMNRAAALITHSLKISQTDDKEIDKESARRKAEIDELTKRAKGLRIDFNKVLTPDSTQAPSQPVKEQPPVSPAPETTPPKTQ